MGSGVSAEARTRSAKRPLSRALILHSPIHGAAAAFVPVTAYCIAIGSTAGTVRGRTASGWSARLHWRSDDWLVLAAILATKRGLTMRIGVATVAKKLDRVYFIAWVKLTRIASNSRHMDH